MAKSRSSGWLGGVTLAALIIPIDANAQNAPTNEPARSFLELRERVRPNGTMIGALVGAASLGLLASPYGGEIAGPRALLGAGIGAGAGIAIDAALW